MREIKPTSWSTGPWREAHVRLAYLDPLPEVGELVMLHEEEHQVIKVKGNTSICDLVLIPAPSEPKDVTGYLDRWGGSKDARHLANEITVPTVRRILRAQERVDVITSLQERMVKADAALREMAAEDGRTEFDQARLLGKAEGIRLALSYVEEMIR